MIYKDFMEEDVIISLDMSTTCTGWSTFKPDGTLINYGIIKPQVKGLSKLTYPKKQLRICQNIADQIEKLVFDKLTENGIIVIEEINRHKNRMSGKTLDALHAIVWDRFGDHAGWLDSIRYIDSDGKTGWRTRLGKYMTLSDADKEHNKEARKLNKILKGKDKIPLVTKKTLACRFVNRVYNQKFDIIANKTDEDICDSIGLGYVYCMYILNKI